MKTKHLSGHFLGEFTVFFLIEHVYQSFHYCSKMGLDLIPRVDGEVVDADSTSVVELYKVVRNIPVIWLSTLSR